jgi:hypothetical protein
LPPACTSPRANCQSTLSLAGIDCHCLRIYTVILPSSLSFSVKIVVSPWLGWPGRRRRHRARGRRAGACAWAGKSVLCRPVCLRTKQTGRRESDFTDPGYPSQRARCGSNAAPCAQCSHRAPVSSPLQPPARFIRWWNILYTNHGAGENNDVAAHGCHVFGALETALLETRAPEKDWHFPHSSPLNMAPQTPSAPHLQALLPVERCAAQQVHRRA